jgi:hypothetical protein
MMSAPLKVNLRELGAQDVEKGDKDIRNPNNCTRIAQNCTCKGAPSE